MRWRGTGDCSDIKAAGSLLDLSEAVFDRIIRFFAIKLTQWDVLLPMLAFREHLSRMATPTRRQDFRGTKAHGVSYAAMERKICRARCRTKALILASYSQHLPLLIFPPLPPERSEFSEHSAALLAALSKIFE